MDIVRFVLGYNKSLALKTSLQGSYLLSGSQTGGEFVSSANYH